MGISSLGQKKLAEELMEAHLLRCIARGGIVLQGDGGWHKRGWTSTAMWYPVIDTASGKIIAVRIYVMSREYGTSHKDGSSLIKVGNYVGTSGGMETTALMDVLEELFKRFPALFAKKQADVAVEPEPIAAADDQVPAGEREEAVSVAVPVPVGDPAGGAEEEEALPNPNLLPHDPDSGVEEGGGGGGV